MSTPRRNRGLRQSFYLLSLSRKDKEWTIHVQGLTNNYVVKINPELMTCSCPDHLQRNNICKHIYFVILKVGGCYQIILNHNISSSKKLNSEDFTKLDNNLVSKTLEHLEKTKKDSGRTRKRKRITHECLICFDEIEDVDQDRECLSQCHKHFHKKCLQRWFQTNQSCPHCRALSSFESLGLRLNPRYDLWEKLNKIEIDILPDLEESNS